MNPTPAVCPVWLANLFRQAGGVVPFRQYMEWALFHPERGYYGSGQVRIGPAGDFATSPSLGSDFAELLAQQLIALLQSLPSDGRPLSLVEVGNGLEQISGQVTLTGANLHKRETSPIGWKRLQERDQLLRQQFGKVRSK